MTDSDHWLVKPATIRRLWWTFSVILALTVIAQFKWGAKGYFGIDGWPGFAALYGFLACLIMVLVAKLLGKVLKRDQRYYSSEDDSA
ncbi:MAG: hypothetical protein ACJA09_000543 [Alcanivorax sp.]|jgi:hypothetical protein